MIIEALTKGASASLYELTPLAGQSLSSSPQTVSLRLDSEPKIVHSKFQLAVKRLVDILGALFGLIVLSPMLLAVAILVAVTSPGPIIYKSLRIGKNQQPFYMYKFRTMVVNADQQRSKLYEQAKLHGQLFKLKNDPRLTPIGSFLRKSSLDEFPQLVNVLKGEMSLVGPRPYIPEESENFLEPYTLRFRVFPGMTGPWQVTGRSNLNFQQLCDLELEYIFQWSLTLDAMLLLKTIPSVLLKKGAY